jgi:phage/plasmid-associated DNA primase
MLPVNAFSENDKITIISWARYLEIKDKIICAPTREDEEENDDAQNAKKQTTPPLKQCPSCPCGKAKRFQVKKAGVNMGKWFVKCTPCDFWEWLENPIEEYEEEEDDTIRPSDSVSQQQSQNTSMTDHAQEIISNYVLAKMFIEKFGHLFIINGGHTFYYFNGQYWQKDCVKGGYSVHIAELFSKDFFVYIDDWLTKTFLNTLSDRQFQNVKKYALRLRETKFKRELQHEIILCEGIKRDVEFDVKPFLLGFVNGVMDFEKNEFRNGLPEDYISTPLSYEWKQPIATDIQFVEKVFKSIIARDDDRKLMCEILFTCMLGIRVNRFIIANGRGGNGKDVIFGSMLPAVLESHCLKSKNQLLLHEELPTGACQELAEMSKKRVAIFSEPNSSRKMFSDTIKELTGSNILNARELYAKETNTRIMATFIMMCNSKPRLDKSDNAMKNRIIDFPFESSFVAPQDMANYPKEQHNITVFERKTEYATIEFWNKYRCAVIEYLKRFKNLNGEFTIPEHIQKRNEEYLSDSDFIQRWMKEHYEYIDNGKMFVKLANVFERFRQSEYYLNMDKKAKRELNKSAFLKMISEHYYYRSFYKEFDNVVVDGNRSSVSNILTHFKDKNEETNSY